MGVVLAWLRLELRRRWRSLAVLALLIAVAAGTVLTAVAGARRGDSAIDRLWAQTLPAHVAILPNQPGFDWTAIRALPEVEALTTFPVNGFGIEEIPFEQTMDAVSFPFDAAGMHTVERPVVLEGRLADPTRADEAVITRGFAERFGFGVGDTVTLRLYPPEVIDTTYLTSSSPSVPTGPAIRTTIVGAVRSGWFSDSAAHEGALIPSAGLFTQYRANLLGNTEVVNVNALARLRDGEAGLPAFQAALARASGRTDIDVWNLAELARKEQRINAFEAACLLAFGLAALAAAVVLVGQAVVRYASATVADLQVLRAVGMRPREALLVACTGPVLAALLGAGLGMGAAVVASGWMPFGNAAPLEPAPGISADWLVLGAGWVLAPVAVLGGAAGAGWLALRAGRTETAPRRSAVALAAGRWGLPVPVLVGTRFALEAGRGRGAVPVRPALLGAVSGVLGVLAAFTFAAGVADAGANPARFGQTHQLQVFFGFNGEDFFPAKPVLHALAGDPDVAGTNDAVTAVVESGGTKIATYSYDPVGAPVPTVLTAGRIPRADNEIALAQTTARTLGSQVGDTITLSGPAGSGRYTVSGIGFVPEGPHNGYDGGAWLTAAGQAALSSTYKFHTGLLTLRPGVDPGAVLPRLSRLAGAAAGMDTVALEVVQPPTKVAQIRQVQVLPVVLGGFLALLAVGAVGHAVATAVRRRRHDVAVLRALGMTRWQARGVVVTHASMLAGIGLVLGVPLGLALGRTLWRAVADLTPLRYVPPVAFWALVLIVPLALLIANVLAAPPGQRAARLRIGHVLRAE